MAKRIVVVPSLVMLFSLSCNPFAPGLDTGEARLPLATIEDVFREFRNAYTFRDTVVYSPLIAPDFTFIYRDYENGVDVTWGRDQEMLATYGLFQNVQNIMLTWNNVITEEGASENDSTIRRSFNLTVTFNPSSIEYVTGYAYMQFRREGSQWRIVRWRDESSF